METVLAKKKIFSGFVMVMVEEKWRFVQIGAVLSFSK